MTNDFQIRNLTLEDADVYECIASNAHGEATFSVSLAVTESESVHVISYTCVNFSQPRDFI